MFEVSVTMEFAAAHRLNEYTGECSNIHGHTWKVETGIASPSLNEDGMVIDFRDLKSALRSVLDQYDHRYLNEIPPFNEINPTAENMAREIYGRLKLLLHPSTPTWVRVWESSSSSALYREVGL